MTYKMRVLIVEDDVDVLNELKQQYSSNSVDAEVTSVDNRDDALAMLEDPNLAFDLVSLDMIIPPRAGAFDINVDHGISVLATCRRACPGTPIFVFTGSSSASMVGKFLRESHNIDVWGQGAPRPTIDHLPKLDITQLASRIEPVAAAIRALNDVELVVASGLQLRWEEDRLLRIFAKKRKAVRCKVTGLGGLSGARVFRLDLHSETGDVTMRAVAKLGSQSVIAEERDNYRDHVVRLAHGAVPQLIEVIEFGAKNFCGAFYQLALDFRENFFQAGVGGALGAPIFKAVETMTSPWAVGGERRYKVQEIRARCVSDSAASELFSKYSLDWADRFEQRPVQTKWRCIHGDLHGGNILVNREQQTVALIDYGDVGEGPAILDPLTLEFSFLFHPDVTLGAQWPTVKQAENWFDLDLYVSGSPIEEIVRFCRAWAVSVATGPREIAAVVYAYCLRQLKYADTNKDVALALLRGAQAAFDRD
ncbi:MAG: hypothetical protein PCALPYG88_4252 [uncultured Paraburkholderia sp.]|uniref:phosphotransferase n=1 Tax=uncultured Paraburkholderia sp. TaxID=1822466 RepID=UPI00259601D8|nr:phosphotransferase [uncultured Paraburkholderia sp.]CAH2900319.1 MAG: hypothetical protein PCALPYG08_4655 [uncultured Paraburkholderia sp.]CAH2928633.1 MAG: hypothetical protein PCALPYG88_4252 [uncultured Paraburkholderia sp.]